MQAITMQLETLRRIVQEVDAALTLHDALEVMVNLVGRNPVQGSQFFRC